MRKRGLVSGVAILMLLLLSASCQRIVKIPDMHHAVSGDVIRYYEGLWGDIQILVSDIRVDIEGSHLFGMMCLGIYDDEFSALIQGYTPIGMPGFELVSSGERFQFFLPEEMTLYSNDIELLGGIADEHLGMNTFEMEFIPPDILIEQLPLIMGGLRREGCEYIWKADERGLRLMELKGDKVVRILWFDPKRLLLKRVEGYVGEELAAELLLKGYRPRFLSPLWHVPRKLELSCQGSRFTIFLDNIRVNPSSAPVISFRPAEGFKKVLVGVE
jgi:hypothetical protein